MEQLLGNKVGPLAKIYLCCALALATSAWLLKSPNHGWAFNSKKLNQGHRLTTKKKVSPERVTLIVKKSKTASVQAVLDSINDLTKLVRSSDNHRSYADASDVRITFFNTATWENNSFGLPDPSTLTGVTHYLIHYCPIWFDTLENSNYLQWMLASQGQRRVILAEYNNCGIEVGVAVRFVKPSGGNYTMMEQLDELCQIVTRGDFQGMEIRFPEESYIGYDSLNKRSIGSYDWPVFAYNRLKDHFPAYKGYFVRLGPNEPL